jgi:hypothetical protein
MWFQYVVGYDKQEQHSLAVSLRKNLWDLRQSSATALDRARGISPSMLGPIVFSAAGVSALILMAFIAWRVRRFGWRRGLKVWGAGVESESSRVDFYERLMAVLGKHGIRREIHQTPLEFASAVGLNEARAITNAYNRVRYGEEKLSAAERKQIEQLLSGLEQGRRGS